MRLVVFNNGRLGMVKLEQEQGGLPEFGTKLHDVDLAAIASAAGLQAIRVTDPDALDEALRSTFAHSRTGADRRGHQPRRGLAAPEGQARTGLGLRHRQADRDAREPLALDV